MVMGRAIDAHEVGKAFAELVQEDSAVRTVWTKQHRGVFEVWLLTTTISPEHERRLYAAAGKLHDIFPHALIEFHLINPSQFDVESDDELLDDILPPGVDEIAVGA